MNNRKTVNIFFILLFVKLISCQYTFAQNPAILVDEFILNNPPFVECHASTIELTDQGLIASWFGGSKEGNEDVEIWMSSLINGKWE